MKKSDMFLMAGIIFVSLIGLVLLRFILVSSNSQDGIATVFYNNSPVLEILLEDGTYVIIDPDYVISIDEVESIYTVTGTNGDVVIEYDNYRVRVIDEISPKNICQAQGWSSSPLKPITCLPNNVVIIIKDDLGNNEPDDISS